MEGMLIFLIFIWALTIIITIVLAVKKGYSGLLAFLLGLFIPLLGSLIIIALLPDKNERTPPVNTNYSSVQNFSGSDLNNIAPLRHFDNENKNSMPSVKNVGNEWICKKCNEKNPLTASNCKSCGAYK